MRRRRIAIN